MPVRVLVVDDNTRIRQMLCGRLESAGIAVIAEAAGGREALTILDDLAADVDVVVIDHQMPQMTGLAAAEAILARSPDQHVLVCTAALTPCPR